MLVGGANSLSSRERLDSSDWAAFVFADLNLFLSICGLESAICFPPLTFRTHRIPPHTDSYVRRLHGSLDLLPQGGPGAQGGKAPLGTLGVSPWFLIHRCYCQCGPVVSVLPLLLFQVLPLLQSFPFLLLWLLLPHLNCNHYLHP